MAEKKAEATENTSLLSAVSTQNAIFPFPAFQWAKGYSARASLFGDLVAGITVGIMLVPQSMAYSMLAGLPPVMGLYSAIIPLLIYPIFATSKHAAVGPVSVICVLIEISLRDLGSTPEEREPLANTLALLVGIVTTSLGFFRVGFMESVLSLPILDGFISAVAIIITIEQLDSLFGIPDIPRGSYISKLLYAIQELPSAHKTTSIIALGSMAVLVLGIVLQKRFKDSLWPKSSTLLVTLAGILLVWLFNLDGDEKSGRDGVHVLGVLPSGFPHPLVPDLSPKSIRDLFPSAIMISLVGFVESIAVMKTIATRHGYSISADHELVSLGLANICGSCFQGFPVFAALSRTPVNSLAGGASQLSGIVCVGLVCVTVMFLMPCFHFLPVCVMASIITVAVCSLIALHQLPFLWKVSKQDFAFMLVSFFCTFGLGVETGIFISVLLSTALIIKSSSFSQTRLMQVGPGGEWHPMRPTVGGEEEEAVKTDGVIALQVENKKLYFANVNHLRTYIHSLVLQREEQVKAVVLDLCLVDEVDSTACHVLTDMCSKYKLKGIDVFLVRVRAPLDRIFGVCGLKEVLGVKSFPTTAGEALKAIGS